jgi:predicted nucleotidyltransferase
MKARAPGQSALLLLDVVAVLAKSSVDYAVIGAMAAAVHGAIRATTDADALVSLAPPRLREVERALRKAGLSTELREGDPDDPIPALLAVGDRHGNRVDLLGGLRGVDPEVFTRTITVPFRGTDLRVIGREDFIAMKCFAAGPQDVADAKQALNAPGPPPDVDLLRRSTRRFGRAAADVLEELLAT